MYGFPEYDPLKHLDLKDRVGQLTVSTVYIFVHEVSGLEPYETMLFKNFRTPDSEILLDYMWRYSTIEEAIQGHAEITAVLHSFESRGWSDALWKAVTDVSM